MADPLEHPAVQRVRAALLAAGAPPRIRVLDETAHTAVLAAQQLGVPVAAICNSLVFATGEPPRAVLVLTSGAHRVDMALAARALGVDGLRRADADLVRAATGFAIGGVAPVGHPAPVPTLLDDDLRQQPSIWAAAGHPRTLFETSFEALLRMTGATPAVVAGG